MEKQRAAVSEKRQEEQRSDCGVSSRNVAQQYRLPAHSLFSRVLLVGNGLMFISLDVGVLDALRAELERRGVDVKDGQ